MTATVVSLTPPSLETFSFQCQDQAVKVDSNIYHLDRLRASLKSNYFEKLFTSGDFKQKNDKILEIQPKHAEVFPSVIDLIHGKKLLDVLSKDNYLPLLETMDQFEMEIDLKIVTSFIDDNLKSYWPEDTNIFELYDFIRKNCKFEYLLTTVFDYFSNHLTAVHNQEILSSMPVHHLIRIITCIQEVHDENRCEIVQTCTKWLCYDLENRLPHMVILINSIKPGFHTKKKSDENNGTSVKCLPKTDVDELAKQKIIARCVFSLLAYGGKLNPTIRRRKYLFFDEYDGDYSDAEWEEMERRQRCEEYDEYEHNNSPATSLVNSNDEYDKLRKFLANGDFYDITVRVGEKTYQLHRAVLESRCDYFAEIFQAELAGTVSECGGIPTCPCKEKEYLLDGVDESSFEAVLDYIYFNEYIGRKFNNIAGVFKAADILKIDDLLENLEKRLTNCHQEVNPLNVVEISNYTCRKNQYQDLYLLYVCIHISTKWPDIDDMPQFCSFSCIMLERVLKSPHLRFDDPHKILDVCATWIIHDTQNRYSCLPRIAQTINPNCSVDLDKCKIEDLVGLNDHSQLRQFVRDKLWEILSTISYILPSEDLQTNRQEILEEIPAFVTSERENTVDILNVDLDEIESFSTRATNSSDSLDWDWLNIKSAAMIDDNLFILWIFSPSNSCTFLVYNVSLKKRFMLSFDFDQPNNRTSNYCGSIIKYTLLNCNDEIYCCSTDGVVKKFSIQLNRWMIISSHRSNKRNILFTSDGEKLYRIYYVSAHKTGYGSNYIVEPYDFEKRVWNRESSLPLIENISTPQQLTIVNGRDLAISSFGKIIMFDHESKTWRRRDLPMKLWEGSHENLFAQFGDRMVIVSNNELYNFSPSNGNWQLKKELPFKYIVPLLNNSFHGTIVPIHRPVRSH